MPAPVKRLAPALLAVLLAALPLPAGPTAPQAPGSPVPPAAARNVRGVDCRRLAPEVAARVSCYRCRLRPSTGPAGAWKSSIRGRAGRLTGRSR
jgi:hypothetical protein